MSRVDLQSTVLQTAAYHSQLALLELEFCSGAIYHYFGVPTQTYRELLTAESKGGYFNHHIRNRFAYTQAQLPTLASGSSPSRHRDV